MAKKKKAEEVTLSPKETVMLNAERLTRLVVLGTREDGGFEISSTEQSFADIIYLLEKGKFETLLYQKTKEVQPKETA